jgi:hypothetical protein
MTVDIDPSADATKPQFAGFISGLQLAALTDQIHLAQKQNVVTTPLGERFCSPEPVVIAARGS